MDIGSTAFFKKVFGSYLGDHREIVTTQSLSPPGSEKGNCTGSG